MGWEKGLGRGSCEGMEVFFGLSSSPRSVASNGCEMRRESVASHTLDKLKYYVNIASLWLSAFKYLGAHSCQAFAGACFRVSFWGSNTFANIVAVGALVVSAITYFSTSSDQHDFEGLRIEATLEDDGRTRLKIPVTYQNAPSALFAAGAVQNLSQPSQPPQPFRVKLSSVGESSSTKMKTILYQDLRPVVCEHFGGVDECAGLVIMNLAIEAEFSRGQKPVNLYEIVPIPLT